MESKSINLPLTSESLQALSAMPVQPQTSSRSQPKTQRTARSEASGTARSAKVETARSGAEAMDSFRSTMSTARAHTALAALTAHKSALEARLAIVEAALEAESKRSLVKGLKGSVKVAGAKGYQAK